LLSNDAHGTNHFRLAQMGIMNINEHKACQPTNCGRPFSPFMNRFCSKICSSKRFLEHF